MRPLQAVTFVLFLLLTCTYNSVQGQDISVLSIEKKPFEKGVELFDDGLFFEAKSVFETMVNDPVELNTAVCQNCPERALFYIAECKFYLNEYDAELYLSNLIRNYRNAPIVSSTIFNIANYYFATKDHKKALSLYQKIDRPSITEDVRSVVDFNSAYIQFKQGEYLASRKLFTQVLQEGSEPMEDAIFYLSICNLELGDINEAEKGFIKIQHGKHKKQIPYYLSHIILRSSEHIRLIDFLTPIIKDGAQYDYYIELLGIFGEALYETENYDGVVEYLGKYKQVSLFPERRALLKLGHAYMLTSQHEMAISTLKELLSEDDEIAQRALFLLGQCYLNTNDRISARSAFLKASAKNDQPSLQLESLFIYATLSKEMKFYDEALIAFGSIPDYHERYNQAIEHIAEIIGASKNYDKALQILNRIDNWTLELKEAFQKLNFHKGLSLLEEDNWQAADESFSKALIYPLDQETRTLTLYWKADVSHTLGKFSISNQHIEAFLIQASKVSDLPVETSPLTAHYLQGYNYLKLNDYFLAAAAFEKILRSNYSYQDNNDLFLQRLVADATIRAGDCYMKTNNYTKALKSYDIAITHQYFGYEHAQYYSAIILGLNGDLDGKLALLDNFILQHNEHELVDDALFEMGETLLAENKPEQAKSVYQKLVHDHSAYSSFTTPSLLRLGLIYYNEDEIDKALQHYRRIFENSPSLEEIGQVLNSVQEIYIQDLKNSQGYFDFITDLPGIQLDETGKDSLSYVAANVPYLNGKYRAAVEAFQHYLNRYPKGMYRVDALFSMANSYLQINDISNGLKAFDQVIAAGTGQYYKKALKIAAVLVFEEMKEYDQALSYFEKYYQSSSDDDARHEALLFCMQSAYKSGNSLKLQEYSRKVLINSRSNTKDLALANYYRGKEAFDNNDFNASLNYLNTVTSLTDGIEAAEARYLIARMYFIKNELTIANKLCQIAIRENANFPYWIAKCMVLQADISISGGNSFDASAILEAVIENYTNDSDGIKEEAKKKIELIKGKVK